jgi:hypothetical protein
MIAKKPYMILKTSKMHYELQLGIKIDINIGTKVANFKT